MAKTFKPENGSRQNFNSLFARLSALEAGHTRLMDRVTQLYTELFTQQETIAAIRTHENEDRAALVALVDSGAKNLVNAPNGSGVRFINIPIVLQPGDYYVMFKNITSTDTDASVCQFGAFANDDSQASNYPQLKRGDNTGAMFAVTKQTSYVRLYAANNFVGGAGDTVTFTGCMICTASDYAVSSAFVPYRPSWQKLYEMILALQSGGASTQSVQPALMSAAAEREEDDTDA